VVAISVPDPGNETYRIVAVALRTPWRDESRTFPIHSGVTGRAYRDKRTIHVPDVREDPDYIALVPTSGSEVAVPIFYGDEVAAVLNVEKETTGGFDHGQVITLQTIADGIGVVLRNAELYQALETTNARLVELDRMKSELVNIVAHDFRAPLAGVLGHAELLEWRPDAPRVVRIEEARSIIHAATHMASLVDKTL
jgi:GAF domain-containing protein